MEMLANSLPKNLYNVNIFVLKWPGFKKRPLNHIKFNNKVNYLFDNKIIKNLSEILFLKYIKEGNYDILYINAAQRNIDLAFQSRGFVKKSIIAIRNIRFMHDPKFRIWISKISKNNFDIICNSNAIKRLLLKEFKINKKSITVIHNGINDGPKNTNTNTNLIYRIMFVGNLREVKNPMFFLKVAKNIIHKRKLNIYFDIVGDGPLMGRVKNYIELNSLDSVIKIHGKISSELIPYKDVNLVFNCSISEGSSNSILESLSFGIPVVASDNLGNIEILQNQSFGRLFKSNSVKSAVEQIEYYYNLDKKSLSLISSDSISYINNHYNKKIMVQKHSNYFKNICYKIIEMKL
jgi:glycosyltransferase involved in cell wall biosynthesis